VLRLRKAPLRLPPLARRASACSRIARAVPSPAEASPSPSKRCNPCIALHGLLGSSTVLSCGRVCSKGASLDDSNLSNGAFRDCVLRDCALSHSVLSKNALRGCILRETVLAGSAPLAPEAPSALVPIWVHRLYSQTLYPQPLVHWVQMPLPGCWIWTAAPQECQQHPLLVWGSAQAPCSPKSR